MRPSVRSGFGQSVSTATSSGPVDRGQRRDSDRPRAESRATPGAGCGPPYVTVQPRASSASAEGQQRAEHVGVGMHVAEHQGASAARRPNGVRTVRGQPTRSSPVVPVHLLKRTGCARRAPSTGRAGSRASGVTRRSRCWRSQLRMKPRALDEGGQRAVPLPLVAEHRDEDLGHLAGPWRLDLGHRHETQPRILQLALEEVEISSLMSWLTRSRRLPCITGSPRGLEHFTFDSVSR